MKYDITELEKHSPEPWTSRAQDSRGRFVVNGALIVAKNDVLVARITRDADKSIGTKIADIGLLVAAPQLLKIATCALDLVALWEAQKISGASRSERNSAIEETRERLIQVINETFIRSPEAAASEHEAPQQGEV